MIVFCSGFALVWRACIHRNYNQWYCHSNGSDWL